MKQMSVETQRELVGALEQLEGAALYVVASKANSHVWPVAERRIINAFDRARAARAKARAEMGEGGE